MDFSDFLCGIPARDYIFQQTPYKEQVRTATILLAEAEIVLLGAGAGASAAAGLTYSGRRFTQQFAEFIEKYGSSSMRDMYSSGFYPFPTEEAKWGYWSKHSMVNRFIPPALPLYKQLYELVKKKSHFVLTTNVDHQFWKAGFADEQIFATQGDYGMIQCEKGCHKKLYDAETLFLQMDEARVNCCIPSELVPKCPKCGGNMAMHLRCDSHFVEDEHWNMAAARYDEFLRTVGQKKTVLLELGVGFNTPTIIRFPFEQMVRKKNNLSLVRINLEEAVVPESLGTRAIGINGDLKKTVADLCGELGIAMEEEG